MTQPETWLLGPLEGYSDILMPVAHSLTQARRELVALQAKTSQGDFLAEPGGIGSIGFHVAHISGSLNRLFSYAKGNELTQIQIDYLHSENDIAINTDKDKLIENALQRIDTCLDELRKTPVDQLTQTRDVGRNRLPSTVMGLFFHAAEHTTMHVGQIRTTLKMVRGSQTP